MPRPPRRAIGGLVYHVLNRANGRRTIFEDGDDYVTFERALLLAKERVPVRLLAYCIMPNHWHLVLWPDQDGALPRFVARLTQLHTQRWHLRRNSLGTGHVYQGRYKSFPVQTDRYFLTLCRYVERNPVRAGLVTRAEKWRWSSLWRRERGPKGGQTLLDAWPLERPREWLALVHQADPTEELAALRLAVGRSRPLGERGWVERVAAQLGLGASLRSPGRPRHDPSDSGLAA
jgi:putative transposase